MKRWISDGVFTHSDRADVMAFENVFDDANAGGFVGLPRFVTNQAQADPDSAKHDQ